MDTGCSQEDLLRAMKDYDKWKERDRETERQRDREKITTRCYQYYYLSIYQNHSLHFSVSNYFLSLFISINLSINLKLCLFIYMYQCYFLGLFWSTNFVIFIVFPLHMTLNFVRVSSIRISLILRHPSQCLSIHIFIFLSSLIHQSPFLLFIYQTSSPYHHNSLMSSENFNLSQFES